MWSLSWISGSAVCSFGDPVGVMEVCPFSVLVFCGPCSSGYTVGRTVGVWGTRTVTMSPSVFV